MSMSLCVPTPKPDDDEPYVSSRTLRQSGVRLKKVCGNTALSSPTNANDGVY